MNPEYYVSVSFRSSTNRWRVALKHHNGDMNSLDRTLSETMCRTEAAAQKKAAELARPYGARILA